MRVQVAVGAVLSAVILALAPQPWLDIEFGPLEADALATHVWHRRFRGDATVTGMATPAASPGPACWWWGT